MKRLLTTLNIKIARGSVLRLSRGFQWSFESASLAEAGGEDLQSPIESYKNGKN